MRALLVPVGADAYAIALDEVREVLRPPVLTTVPTAPTSLLGVFNLRGEVVVLLDTASVLGVSAQADIAEVVVVDAPDGVAALSATAATSSVELIEHVGESHGPGTRGRYAIDGAVATLMDLPAVLAAVGNGA